MAKKQGIPPWAWVGCGCLLFPALIVVVAAAFGLFAFNFSKDAIDKMADPEKRAASARETLGAEAVPAGWHVRTYFAIPFGFTMIVLGDGTPPPPPEGESFEDKARTLESLNLGNLDDNRRLFIYLEPTRGDENTLVEILNSKGRGTGMNLDLGVRFESENELSRGDLQVKGHRVAFQAKKGTLDRRLGHREPIVYSELAFECQDKQRRLGLLFERLPQPAASGPEALEAIADQGFETAGTPADAAVLQSFLDHFAVCQ